jgi:hypothetical protein
MLQPQSQMGKFTDISASLKRDNNPNDRNVPPTKPPDNDPAPEQKAQVSAFTQSLVSITASPGPDYYAARRALWLKPSGTIASASETGDRDKDDGRPPILKRLDGLLEMGADSDEAWESGVERVWNGLIAGGHLKWRLPMTQVVCSLFITLFQHIRLGRMRLQLTSFLMCRSK